MHKIDSKLTEFVRYQLGWHNHALRTCYSDVVNRYSIRLNHTKRYICWFVRSLRSKNRLYSTGCCARLTESFFSDSFSFGFANIFGRSCVLARLAPELATANARGSFRNTQALQALMVSLIAPDWSRAFSRILCAFASHCRIARPVSCAWDMTGIFCSCSQDFPSHYPNGGPLSTRSYREHFVHLSRMQMKW